MIALLLAWVTLAVGGYGAGTLLLGKRPPPQSTIDHMVATIWAGSLWIAAALLSISLVLPLRAAGPLWLVLCAALGVFELHRAPRRRVLERSEWIAIGVIAAVVAFAMCGRINLYDTGLYHRQNITMLGEHGTLAGAALIYYRLGFSSSWFALSAALEPWLGAGRMGAAANGFLMMLATIHLASALWRITRGKAGRDCWYLAVAYPVAFYYLLLESAAVSPSPNAAVALSLVLLGWRLATVPGDAARVVFVFAGGVACLKLTAIPAAIIPLLARGRSEYRNWVWVVVGSLPLLTANLVTSGYPIFPGGPGIQTGHTMSRALARRVELETMDFGSYGFSVPESADRGIRWWIGGWLRRADKPLLGIFVLSLGILLLRVRFPAEAFLGMSGCAFLLLTAPDFRFLCGYIAILAGSAAMACAPSRGLRRLGWMNPVAWALLAALCWTLYAIGRESLARSSVHTDWVGRLLVPIEVTKGSAGQNVQLDSISISRPATGDQCWNLTFPCTPNSLHPGARLCRPVEGVGGGVCLGTRRP
jgi:hypothetical protein